MMVQITNDTMELIFILKDYPELKYARSWLSIPFSFAFLVAFIGNVTILSVTWSEPSLHQPMCYFLSILALNDLSMSLSTLPTMLSVTVECSEDSDKCLLYSALLHPHINIPGILSAIGHAWSLTILLLSAVHRTTSPYSLTV